MLRSNVGRYTALGLPGEMLFGATFKRPSTIYNGSHIGNCNGNCTFFRARSSTGDIFTITRILLQGYKQVLGQKVKKKDSVYLKRFFS